MFSGSLIASEAFASLSSDSLSTFITIGPFVSVLKTHKSATQERAANPARIYLSSPHMGIEEERFVQEAFRTNWITPVGLHGDAIERVFAARRGGAGRAVSLRDACANKDRELRV